MTEYRRLPTLREIAAQSNEWAVIEQSNADVYGRMPGDDDPHPIKLMANPMPEIGGALALSRALREGQIPYEKERAVRAYLQEWQRTSKEVLYDPRNHRVVEDDEEPVSPLQRADRWPFDE